MKIILTIILALFFTTKLLADCTDESGKIYPIDNANCEELGID